MICLIPSKFSVEVTTVLYVQPSKHMFTVLP
jgi:hypothetical protein